jgi:hypothetical protein
MHQETFQRYLAVYQQQQPQLSSEQVQARVARLPYWVYARYDPAIRSLPLPDCVLASIGKHDRS